MDKYVIRMQTGAPVPISIDTFAAVGEEEANVGKDEEEGKGERKAPEKMVQKRKREKKKKETGASSRKGSRNKNGDWGNRIALTWGDAGENHVGMELVGDMQEKGTGFTFHDLECIAATATEAGLVAEVHGFGHNATFGAKDNGPVSAKDNGPVSAEDNWPVKHTAGVLVIRNLVEGELLKACGTDLNTLEWDSKYWDRRRQKVLNKRARTNLMFQHGVSQTPSYEEGKGRIVDLDTLKAVATAEKLIFSLVQKGLKKGGGSTKWVPLVCEGNNYYDLKKTGIGFHGDSERTRVACLSVGGHEYPMRWQWFLRSKVIGPTFDVQLNSGDVYVMSEKAVGQNWKCRSIPTLRHAAGCAKYTKIQDKWKTVQE